MTTFNLARALGATLIGLSLAGSATVARADPKDYEFQLVQKEMKKGDGAVVAVRLVDRRTGKPVPDAVIFAKRIDMAPDGMPTMTAPLSTSVPGGSGITVVQCGVSGSARSIATSRLRPASLSVRT